MNPNENPANGRLTSLVAIVAIAAVAAIAGVSVVIDPDGTTTITPDRPDVTKVDGADRDAKADDPVVLTPRAEDVRDAIAKDVREGDSDLDPDEPGAPPLAGSKPPVAEGVIPAPHAADSIDGCRTRFMLDGGNFSSRGVAPARVVLFELHFTAGPDVPNSRADVDGLTAYGNRSSSRVSWHFNMDKDGNCDYNVPLRLKAWTIADLNPYTINVEVAGRGEAPYLRPAGFRKLALIIRQVRRAYPGIKLAVGEARNCRPVRGGLDTHWRNGACAGSHSDIKPHDLAAIVRRLRAILAPAPPRAIRTDCRHVARHRARERAGSTTPAARSHARAHLANAKRRGWECRRDGKIVRA
jgi:hypothetical protein